MNEKPDDKNTGGILELRCPRDHTLVLRYSKDVCGLIEGKCRKCKRIVSLTVSGDNVNKQ